MKNKNFDDAISYQLWPERGLHVPNLSDEIIAGNDKNKQGAGAMGVNYYLCRMQGAFKKDFKMLIPEEFHENAEELSDYHREYGLNNFEKKDIIPVHSEGDENFSVSCINEIKGIMRHKFEGLLIPVISSENSARIARELNMVQEASAESAHQANHKYNALSHLAERGVQVPFEKPFATENEAKALYLEFKSRGIEKMLAKANRGASGQAIWEIMDSDTFDAFLGDKRAQEIMHLDGFAMQELVENIVASPNVLFYVSPTNPEQDRIIKHSYQLLEKNSPEDLIPQVHKGNVGPLRPEHWEQLPELQKDIKETMAWLRSVKAFGPGGIDVIIYHDPKDNCLKHKIIEINFRFNGNSAAAMMSHDQGAHYFGADNNVQVPELMSINEYINTIAENHYSPDTNEGIFVTNSATSAIGKMQIGAMAHTRERLDELMKAAHLDHYAVKKY